MDLKIEDLALIGDLHTAALVDRTGSIVWACLPRFDSDTPFAALLGGVENGCWQLRPAESPNAIARRYAGDTLILETTFTCRTGSVRLIDFMPRRDERPVIVRIVEGVDGSVEMESMIRCRFNFGQLPPWTRKIGDAFTVTVGANGLAVRVQKPTSIENQDIITRFTLGKGERVAMTMQWYPSHEDPPQACDPEQLLRETERNWNDWARDCAYRGPHRETVMRSLITLKALTYEPSGGSVAAVTTSLPEQIGAEKNWDYRFAWVRDSAFTVDALVAAGYHEEARAWRDWLLRMLAGDPSQLQIMYSVTGDRHLQEWDVEWLRGYENSRPVRLGNGAYNQFQLGVYGELMEALTIAHHNGIELDEHAWEMIRLLLQYVEGHWDKPDSGLWERRGKQRHYTHSRMMAWVAFDRAITIMENDGFEGPLERYRRMRDTIANDVLTHGYDERRKTFVQSYESDDLDASLLLMPVMGFLPADDERVQGTIAAIERELMVDGFVMRYSQDIHRQFGRTQLQEGAFLACNAWLVQTYVKAGRLQDAQQLLERMLRVANDVGLLAEEYDVERKRLIGNFPQTFSHATLVNAILDLSHAQGNR